MRDPHPLDEFYNHDAMGLAELISKGEITAEELLEVVIKRIETVNPKLNAIEQRNYELARERARKGLPKGPFSGVPSFVKANTDFPGFSTTWCSKGFADAPVVTQPSPFAERYIEAGLNIVGKTALPEFAYNTHTESHLNGRTRNPWDPSLTTGGSSGGAAALVASGVVPMAHGTDGGGSCRIPSSHCHTLGLKTSRGRHVSTVLVTPTIKETQTNQMITRSVRDLAMSFALVEQRGDNATYPELGFISGPSKKRLKIAVATKTEDGQSADADVLDVVMRTAELCRQMGHEVGELDCVPYSANELLEHKFMDFISILTQGIAANFEKMHGRPVADGDFEALGMYYLNMLPDDPDAALKGVWEYTDKVSDAFDKHFESYDLILTPTVPVVPKEAADRSIESNDPTGLLPYAYRDMRFLAFANLTGHPTMSVPAGFSWEGLPVGVNFIAAKGAEDKQFSIAYELEDELKWARHWPRISVATAGS